MENLSSKRNNLQIEDSTSSSSISDSDENRISSSESESEQQPLNKQTNKNVKQTNKNVKTYTAIRPVKVHAITKKIKSMQGPLYNLLKHREGHEYIIKSLNLTELRTIKNIFSSVENLKQIKHAHGYYTLPADTKQAFENCKNEIDHFYNQNKKLDLQKALLAIERKDNFSSIRKILTTNQLLSKMQKRILTKKLLQNAKK